MDSSTPIQPVLINDDQKVMQVRLHLREQGFLVGAIRPPTVPVGSGRSAYYLSADHSEEQVDQLVTALDSSALCWFESLMTCSCRMIPKVVDTIPALVCALYTAIGVDSRLGNR